ncbi:HEAT repeat domain-containing protein, partial [filamentous cyanobacterium LEGE 11480]
MLDWMAIAAVAGKALLGTVVGKGAGALIGPAKTKLFPGELEKAIAAGLQAAYAEDERLPREEHVFLNCDDKQQRDCLGRVMQAPALLKELKKPLEGVGKLDVACLVEVLKQERASSGLDLVEASFERWLTCFAETYFSQTSAAIEFQVTKQRYLDALASRVDDVKFIGIAVPGEEVEKQEQLAQIFVMPNVREEKASLSRGLDSSSLEMRLRDRKTGEILEAITKPTDLNSLQFELGESRQAQLLENQRSWAMRDRSDKVLSAQKVLSGTKNKAVLLGAPGSGKTTLASYFALMLCGTGDQYQPNEIGLKPDDDWLPVVIRIRDWVQDWEKNSAKGVLEYLRWYVEQNLSVKKLPPDFFEHWLDRGKALILLDGLDEAVNDKQRRDVVERIETFLAQYGANPAIVTSRPAGYRWDFFDQDEFPHYTLEPFDDQQVETFIDHWYDSREPDASKATRKKSDLRKALAANDRVKLLAKNPLLLTIITLIHRYRAELPRQRYQLYEWAVETLLTSWDSNKDIRLYEVLEYLKRDNLLYVLKKLAYWIHTQGSTRDQEGGTLIDKDELLRKLSQEIHTLKPCEFHEAKEEAKRFVDFIQKRTGLLNEQGYERYAFVHKTFQEYLTAEEIYDRFEEGEDEVILEHIAAHLHDQHWREVLLLLVSKLKKKRAAKAVRQVYRVASEHETYLRRDLLFAGWCLTEDPQGLKGADAELVDGILDGLVRLEVGDSDRLGYKVCGEAAKILHRLGETEVEADTWQRLSDRANDIDRSRLLSFQASLGQEEEAITILLALLKDDDSDVRSRAASSLVQLGNGSESVVGGLLALLKDDDSDVRYCAASSLGQLGNGSELVVGGLLALLKDDDWNVRSRAAESLGQLGNGSESVVGGLLALLKDDNWNVRSRAASSLVQLGNGSESVVGSLLALLKDDDSDVRYCAASSLGQLGNGSESVVGSLLA